jgi:hypothetical protein
MSAQFPIAVLLFTIWSRNSSRRVFNNYYIFLKLEQREQSQDMTKVRDFRTKRITPPFSLQFAKKFLANLLLKMQKMSTELF